VSKLCHQKSGNLVAQFNELVTNMEEKLTKAIHLVYKAIDEAGCSVFYVRMCGMKKVLAENGCHINFRTLSKRLNIFFKDFI
jgi:transcriptional regulator